MPLSLEYIEKQAEHLVKNLGLEAEYAELAGKILPKLGMAGMWPVGSSLTNKAIESYGEDLSDKQKRAIQIAGDVAFGAPVLYYTMGKPFVEDFKEAGWADASMSGLSLGIGAAGIAYNDTGFKLSAAALGALFTMAKNIEEHIKSKGQQSFDAVKEYISDKATKVTEGKRIEVDATEIADGDQIFVKKGEVIPVDAEAIKKVRIYDPTGVTGEPGAVIARGSGEAIVQGAIAHEDMTIQATSTQEKSTLSRLAEIYDEENYGKKGAKIKDIVNKAYVPLMLASVLMQFGYRYHKDQMKHAVHATEQEHAIRLAENMPEPDPEQIAQMQQQLEEYQENHGADHSFRSALERSAQLAVKMAPCAIMAGLLIYPFIRFKLRADHGITANNEGVLDKIRDNFKTIVTDLRGPIVKYGNKINSKTVFDKHGKEITGDLAEEHHLMHGHAQADSGHVIAKTVRREQKLEGKTPEDFVAPPPHVAIEEGIEGGVKAFVEEGAENKGLFISGNESLIKENLEALGAEGIPEFIKTAAAKAGDPVISVYKKADGSLQWGITDIAIEFEESALKYYAECLDKGQNIVIASGSSQKIVDQAVQKILEHTKDATKAEKNLKANAGITSAEKVSVVKEHLQEGDLFVGDGINDLEAAKEAKTIGAHSIAIDNRFSGFTQRFSDLVIQNVGQIKEVMTIPEQISKWAKINLAVTGTYVAGLTGHHLYNTFTKDQREEKKQQMEANGEEFDDKFYHKQLSTLGAALAHEVPTGIVAALAAVQSGMTLKKMGRI